MSAIESKEFWEQHIEKQKSSGLSRSQYCSEYGINYHRFGYWLKKLLPSSSGFVPVKIQTPAITTNHATLCTVELRGHVLKIHDLTALSFILGRLEL
jgi:hypothetical protein